ncbi:MAG: hypothetical protein JW395_1867 [Nitrospira sp.]|nr:hypothetical protein [Nitrospira sp.]
MVTRQILRGISVPVLGVVLFATPVWADVDSRSGVPPIQSHQPVTLHEDQGHGAQSTPMYRGGLPANSLKLGDLNLKSVGEKIDGSRATANSHSSFNSIRSDDFQEHDARGSGIPLWRW